MASPADDVSVTLPGRAVHSRWVSGVNSVGPTDGVRGTRGRKTLRQWGCSCIAEWTWSPSLCHFCVSEPGADMMHPIWARRAWGPRIFFTRGVHGAFAWRK
eukprot:CAMPEP_0185758590 /NCGR_PEP_ID=MMETSP1174-20130828/17283_1 /TAXON_ID=35687 /ORGANISM="Dictyocha speculum, Strain CCMP1381" /LENGTH=100 /DNA_ID=CAMNT_0028438533 /DNA_START=619 /DNA_END=918 /DNA_ORIENTATION=+